MESVTNVAVKLSPLYHSIYLLSENCGQWPTFARLPLPCWTKQFQVGQVHQSCPTLCPLTSPGLCQSARLVLSLCHCHGQSCLSCCYLVSYWISCHPLFKQGWCGCVDDVTVGNQVMVYFWSNFTWTLVTCWAWADLSWSLGWPARRSWSGFYLYPYRY